MRGFLNILQSNPVFAIEPTIGVNMLMYVLSVLNREESLRMEPLMLSGSEEEDDEKEPVSHIMFSDNGLVRAPRFNYETRQHENVDPAEASYVYKIHGTLLAESQMCGPRGMNQMAEQIRLLASIDAFNSVVLDIQSPGGQVLGNENLAQAIEDLAQHKTVVTLVNGMAASAAYKIAAPSNHVMASGPGAQIGSIGTMISYLDFTKFLKKEGVEQINIVSNLSPNKNKFNFSEPSEKDIKIIKEEWLDPLTANFHESVKRYRPGIKEEALTGDMFMASEAEALGLVDSVGSYQEAIILAIDMAKNNQKSTFMLGKKKTEQKSEEMISVTEHNEALAQKDQEIETLRQEQADKLTEMGSQITELKETVNTLQQTVSDLKKAPVNEVANPEGKEGAAVQALQEEKEFEWGGFGEEKKAQRKADMAAS